MNGQHRLHRIFSLSQEAELLAPLPDEHELEIVVVLRPSPANITNPAAIRQQYNSTLPPQMRPALAHRDLPQIYEPRREHVEKIKAFARHNDLHVVQVSSARHDVTLSGTVAALNRAFGTTLHQFRLVDQTFHSHAEEISMPDDIAPFVEGVLGLDDHPVRTTAQFAPAATTFEPVPVESLVRHYRFPPVPTKSTRVAVIALGGGYHREDMESFFTTAGVAMPTIRDFNVDGATNNPLPFKRLSAIVKAFNNTAHSMGDLRKQFGDDLSKTRNCAESTMDVQISAIASGSATIDVFFAPNTMKGFYSAINSAVGLNPSVSSDDATSLPNAISISWGWGERQMTGQAARMIESVLSRAQSMGVCICAASGDLGSLGTPQRKDRKAGVLYPSSSPHVLACGGTAFSDSAMTSEGVWNENNRGSPEASGGGISGALPLPWWQRAVPVPNHAELNGPAWISPGMSPEQTKHFAGRGVPDVAAYSSQIPGYSITLGGVATGCGGTSAATPLWAGLATRISGWTGTPMAYLNQLIYDPRFAPAFRKITSGTNAIPYAEVASFDAGGIWNACCGLGVPDGDQLLALVNLSLGRNAPPPVRSDFFIVGTRLTLVDIKAVSNARQIVFSLSHNTKGSIGWLSAEFGSSAISLRHSITSRESEIYIEALRLAARALRKLSPLPIETILPVPLQDAAPLEQDGFIAPSARQWLLPAHATLQAPEKAADMQDLYSDPMRVVWNFEPRIWQILDPFIAELRNKPTARVLDIGCGFGKNTVLLEGLGFATHGVDVATGAIEQCRRHSSNPARLQVASIESLPYTDGYFDAILDVGCLHCLPGELLEPGISELARVTKPGGTIYSRAFKPRNQAWLDAQNYDVSAMGLDSQQLQTLFEHWFNCTLHDIGEATLVRAQRKSTN